MNNIPKTLAAAAALSVMIVICAPAAAAQRKAPAVCPYCKDDPKILAPAGLGGHGKMAFGKSTSEDLKRFLSYADPLFIESKHFRICSTLRDFSVPETDWKTYEAELVELKKTLPAVKPRERELDPWLRLHLYAQRCEKRYQRFLDILQMKDSDFYKREIGKPYRGEGPYLGMQDKYELVLLRNMREFTDTLRDQSGSTTKMTKREHFTDRGVISLFVPCEGDLKPDDQLWAHIAHNLGHNFVLGLKHYSYEPPRWFEEGFAHLFEGEVNPEYHSFDSEEAALAEMTAARDWYNETVKILDKGKAAPLADLVHKKSFSEISKEDHVIVWSKVQYLVTLFPNQVAKYLDAIRGRLNDKGFADGSDLIGIQRKFFKEELNMSFPEFDKNWEKWVRKTYIMKPAR